MQTQVTARKYYTSYSNYSTKSRNSPGIISGKFPDFAQIRQILLKNPSDQIRRISLRNYELKPYKGLETYRGCFPKPISLDFPQKSTNQNLGFSAKENKDYAMELEWIEDEEWEIYLWFGGISP